MESAGISDLVLNARVDVSPANVKSGSRATNTKTEDADAVRVRRSSLTSVDVLGHEVSVEQAASNHLEFRIDKLRIMMIYSKEFEWVNNIWIEASQCLTARVDA